MICFDQFSAFLKLACMEFSVLLKLAFVIYIAEL